MITPQIIKRNFYEGTVEQNHKTGFFNIKSLTEIGNKYRKSVGMAPARWDVYLKSNKTKELIRHISKQHNIAEVISTKRGRNSSTWAHPLVFFDYAMWVSPEFKVYVYEWLYDNLTVFRDSSGDSYKKLCAVLIETQNYSPGKVATIITGMAKAIKRDLKVTDWNQCCAEKLKDRDSIHKTLSLMLQAGVDPIKAYGVIKREYVLKWADKPDN